MPERLRGLILPHAPVLLPEVLDSRSEGAPARVRAAIGAAARGLVGSRALVASPHGVRTGVCISPYGDLADLGPRAPAALCPLDLQKTEELADRWRRPLLDEPLDHGIVVPLLLAPPTAPIVAVTFAEGADPSRDVEDLVVAVGAMDLDVVIASANLSAGVTDRAPLTRLPEAEELERETEVRLRSDAGSLLETAPRLASEAGSCALGPLTLFARLFRNREVDVLAHEWPYGVGYLVARTRDAA